MPVDGSPEHWTQRFERQVLRARTDIHEHNGQYLFRPGQLIVHHDDRSDVERHLSEWNAQLHDDNTGRMQQHDIPLRVYQLGDDHRHEVPRVVQTLRGRIGDHVRVTPNHIFAGAPGYTPGGAGVPVPSAAAERSTSSDRPTGEPLVAILDTGLPRELAAWHESLAKAVAPVGRDEVDVLDADGDGYLDLEAGHGTFVAAILRQHAPRARFSVDRVLEPCGIGDEIEIADAIGRNTAPILSMSLGGYTHDDQPPMAIASAIAGMANGRLVVASAGNGGRRRETYPAAIEGVIGVGALAADSSRAPFSNFGSWVGACAPGVDLTAAYVHGEYPVGDEVENFTGWARWSGTSFAVPRVVAAIANWMLDNPGVTARDAWKSLTADPERPWVDDLGYVF